MRSDISSWNLFKSLNIEVFDSKKDINLTLQEEDIVSQNKKRVKKYFSQKNYRHQLEHIFNSSEN